MALAYTPGLKIQADAIIRRERRLPIAGEVMVKIGDAVTYDKVIAKAKLPGEPSIVNVAGVLGCDPKDITYLMIKKAGQRVRKGEIIASTPGLFGLFKTQCASPTDGTIYSVSETTGQVIIISDPIEIQTKAYISGKIVDVLPKYGAIVETRGAIVQGIFGVGGETQGEVMVLSDSPEKVLTKNDIRPECRNKILIGGSAATSDAVKEAIKQGAKGIIVGGIEAGVLDDCVGYEIGVGITGHEELGLTLIVTEGFGNMAMSLRTFKLLKSLEGKLASINGATQIRAGVIRPEVIIPRPELTTIPIEAKKIEVTKGMEPGMLVRIVRQPYFGHIGQIVDLPVDLQKIQTESLVRVAAVELENKIQVTVPRANLEIIEE